MENQNVTVLGCGRWGTFLAWYNDRKGNNVTLWGRPESRNFAALREYRHNDYVSISDTIKLTCDINEAIKNADIIIISISSQELRSFIRNLDKKLICDKPIVLCMKGIEATTGKRLTEVAIEEGIDKMNIAVWLGPGHIQEFAKGIPNCMIIDSYNPELTTRLVDCFHSELIRFYFGTDIIGNEIGGATKNIIGIAAGMLDALNFKTLKGPLMARGVSEVSRLITAMGGKPQTAYGLAHLGDYETTLFSEHSQNRRFGESFIRGDKYDKLAEGVLTTKAVVNLAAKFGIEMPITNCIYQILFNNSPAKTELDKLFSRGLKHEF